MKINKNDLVTVLQKIKPAISTKGIVEDLSCFLFQQDMIYAYNDKLCIGMKNPIPEISNCSIPSMELIKILQGINAEEVDVALTDGELSIKGGRTRVRLKLIDTKLSELIPSVAELKWKKLPSDFSEGIFLCLFSASRDLSVPFLNCIYVKGPVIISSDNFRISRYSLSKPIKDSFLLPLASAVELQNFDVVEYSLNDGWVFFRKAAEENLFCARIVAAEYPDVARFFEQVSAPSIELPSEIKDGISVCEVLSDENQIDKKMELIFENGEILCRGESVKGMVEYSVAAEVPDGISFSVNPIFLSHVLSRSTTASIEEGRLYFSSDQFSHIMALPE